jgi:hypothetical protein
VPLAQKAKRLALFDRDFALLAGDRWPEYGGTQVFYSDAHLLATLTSMFTICSMTRDAYGYQTAVIVTHPSEPTTSLLVFAALIPSLNRPGFNAAPEEHRDALGLDEVL